MLKTLNNSAFLRIYLTIFASLFILMIFLVALRGYDLWRSLFLLSLVCLPISLVVLFIINQLGSSLTNGLYGLGIKEDHTEEIRNSEIIKLIALKEEGKYETVLTGLEAIEEQYGLSSRLIYERAQCLLALGELRKARRCIKDFLSTTQPQKGDAYYEYCRQLISHKDAPLTLENIMQNLQKDNAIEEVDTDTAL